MQMKKWFVSDVHIGLDFKPDPKHPGYHDYNWLSDKERAEFASFIQAAIDDKEPLQLILLGDTFDNWVCPVDRMPPSFEEIFTAPCNTQIVTLLNTLCSTPDKEVYILPGNHDMGLTEEIVKNAFPKMVFAGSANNDSCFMSGRLRAEHGSAHTLFNSPDPMNNPGTRLPLGYFITRVVATRTNRTGKSNREVVKYIDDLLEAIGPQTLSQSVFEAVLEEAKLAENTEILMHEPCGKITAAEVKKKYAGLYDQWASAKGSGPAFKAMMAEIGYLGDIADRLCKKKGTNLVVFGHSHEWVLDKDSWFVDDRIYANCGCWCDNNCPRTFVEVDPGKDGKKQRVSVKEWKDGKISVLKTETL